MSRAFIQKGIGLALIISGVVLLILKSMSLPEAKAGWDAWASPGSGTALFAGAFAAELLLIAAQFYLGYLNFRNRCLSPWGFYPLTMLVAVSGVQGIVLAAACLAIRLWPGQGHAAKTERGH